MRISEITVNSHKRLMDMLKHGEFISNFYTFYEYHHGKTYDFTNDLYRIYNPTELSNIQDDVYNYKDIIPQLFNTGEQPLIMINDLVKYFIDG